MSGEAPTPEQLSPDVSARPIVGAVALAFAIAVIVMGLLAFAFWFMLGNLPNDMTSQAVRDFPQPRLQVVPTVDLQRSNASGEAQLTQVAKIPIDAAMRLVAARPDPYAPLLPQGAVPDGAGLRAMRAQTAQRPSGGIAFDAGARTGVMSPEIEGAPPPDEPGLAGEQIRVPSGAFDGTPNYQPPPKENSGVER
ncbi:hypothetical protein [Jiella avicenniae]|uniref:Uncharacterized protein n=1 Tax=Jiella avicenniae TaxID=2907202 RepID=A0A9X1T4P6_9HYPH|nr:hypothetical protein [Jiella avicenniae]MCE7027999.1 hypothetical protein [Jiella avicenniae]